MKHLSVSATAREIGIGRFLCVCQHSTSLIDKEMMCDADAAADTTDTNHYAQQ